MAMKCSAPRKDGTPCQGTALPGQAVCFAHSAEMAGRRLEGSRKGGVGKATRQRARKHFRDLVMEPEDINGLLSDCLRKVASGDLEPSVGQAVASMSRALIAVQEASTLTERIEELERAAGIAPDNVTPLRRTA